jgi:hypothetical protein
MPTGEYLSEGQGLSFVYVASSNTGEYIILGQEVFEQFLCPAGLGEYVILGSSIGGFTTEVIHPIAGVYLVNGTNVFLIPPVGQSVARYFAEALEVYSAGSDVNEVYSAGYEAVEVN